jgi:hypothetical protein
LNVGGQLNAGGDVTVSGYITSGALFPTSISSSASIRAGTTLSVAGTAGIGGKITGDNGFEFHNTRIGTIQYTTANFFTFPTNGVYLFLISVCDSTNSIDIAISDNLTKVYVITICNGYPAQMGLSIFGTSGYFNVTGGTTNKSISFTTNDTGFNYSYFYNRIF